MVEASGEDEEKEEEGDDDAETKQLACRKLKGNDNEGNRSPLLVFHRSELEDNDEFHEPIPHVRPPQCLAIIGFGFGFGGLLSKMVASIFLLYEPKEKGKFYSTRL